jgi:hypothetical protein
MGTNRTSSGGLPPEAASFYREALMLLNRSGVPYLVGGAYAFARYTGIERNTKDFDVLVRQKDCSRVLDLLAAHRCRTELTFPHWLAKAYREDLFIDLIFGSGNGLCRVDDEWWHRAPDGEFLGQPARLVPPEEMIWSKAFILERERYDGADVAHLLRARCRDLDWPHLLHRFGPQWRVLLSHLILFGFVYPAERDCVPSRVLHELVSRLLVEGDGVPPDGAACQGTLLSREQYLPDVERWGYRDARLLPTGNMTPENVRQWTEGIKKDKELKLEQHQVPPG